MSSLQQLLEQVKTSPDSIEFANVMAVIDAHYTFVESAFSNGDQVNEAGQNNGSCKIFSFAHIHQLSQGQTLQLFGDYYRKDVLQHPQADDHQNIRQFIEHGWEKVVFSQPALTAK